MAYESEACMARGKRAKHLEEEINRILPVKIRQELLRAIPSYENLQKILDKYKREYPDL